MREALSVLTELERDRLVSEEMTEEIPDEEEKAYAQMQWNQLVLIWVLSINGRKFHDLIMDNRTEIDTNLSTALVDMDGKYGNFDKAVDLFNGIHPSERNASSWNIDPGMVIRATKNLRVCSDCQSALKVVSQTYQRKNIVRDANRQGLLVNCGSWNWNLNTRPAPTRS
ncbi:PENTATRICOPEPTIDE REPEAT-CONTAINING PROTEIN [Salix viminalis]|uniref:PENTATRICOPEPTIDE REPEAT-CONTAINING PROTEIN n=1 Tax=Salix viminalis TaxID=40686 RepID=A0A9Q0NV10_SALVM|nr:PENTATRICOPEPTIDE REPEAT-CONTAINING PROTEIN [Salix viminalis]